MSGTPASSPSLRGFFGRSGLLIAGLALCFSSARVWSAPNAGLDHCTCAPLADPDEARRNADLIFEGRVVALHRRGKGRKAATVIEFDVLRAWKGEGETRLRVLVRDEGRGCDRSYEAGRSYLVYARQVGSTVQDNGCSRSNTIEAAGDDLKVLGEPAWVNDALLETPVVEETPPLNDAPPAPHPAPPVASAEAPTEEMPPPLAPRGRGCSSVASSSNHAWLTLLAFVCIGKRRRRSSRAPRRK